MNAPFRYARIGHAALAVTDLERSVRFYTDLIGLELVERREGQAFLRCSSDHHNVLLQQGPVAGLLRVGFQLASLEDLRKARAHFEAAGLAPADVPAQEAADLRQGPSFRVREPGSGLTLEYYAQMVQMPQAFQPRLAHIARLGHVLVTTPDYERALENFTTTFNFRVSDHTPGHSAFLRCFPNPYHHSFGVAKGRERHLHHVNFMVGSIDDVGRAMNRLRKAGVEIVFGPGRHFASGSIFLYFLDPDGLTLEYSFEMEEFPEHGAREPRMLERTPETSDMWGSTPQRPLEPYGPIL